MCDEDMLAQFKHWHFWRIVKAVMCFTHKYFCPQSILHCTVIRCCCSLTFSSLTRAFRSSVWSHFFWTADTLIIWHRFCTTLSHFWVTFFNSNTPQGELANCFKCFTILFQILMVVYPNFNIVLEVTDTKVHLSRNYVPPPGDEILPL